MTPVSIVTGFLGSGKTTLIGRILRNPAFSRTAVIVNELGEIGLDHALIAHSDETFLTLTTGCLCCAVRSDLVATLLDLADRRDAGTAAFDRVLIETSGMADPAPILHALMTQPAVGAVYRLDVVVTVVDALFGSVTLADHQEARRQAALADVLLLSKTDLVADRTLLLEDLQSLNPTAHTGVTGSVAPGQLFGGGERARYVERLARLPGPRGRSPFSRGRHTGSIESFVLQRDRPLPALALTLFLQALAEHCGARLLRMKGLVGLEEMPDHPAVVHGVRHVFSPPEFLPAWPDADRSTRLVFIGSDLPRYFPARLLDVIEAEVREASGD